MTSYVKIYGNQLIRSTVWVNTDKETKLIWITLLAIADKHGIVLASIPGLARDAGVSIEECERSLATLRAPDKYSRTKEYEGRRLEDVDGGFLLLNYKKYREMRTEIQVKEAERKAAWRAKKAAAKDGGRVPGQTDVPSGPTESHTTPAPAPTPSLSTSKEVDSVTPDMSHTATAYYRACTIALNQGMEENPTVEGEWIPVAASTQVDLVTWMEDGIPLEVAETVIRKRAIGYRSTAQRRGPHTLRYFDAAVQEAWDRGQMSAAEKRVEEAFQ